MHIFRLVKIFPSEITWRLPIYRGVFANDKIIHDIGRWPVGMICLTHKCKPRGVCMFMVKVSLKKEKSSSHEKFFAFFSKLTFLHHSAEQAGSRSVCHFAELLSFVIKWNYYFFYFWYNYTLMYVHVDDKTVV